MDALLAIDGLSVVFGGLRAVDKLDLAVMPGSIHALIGPNGAGKTTVLNVTSGFYKPTEGTLRFDGVPIQGKVSSSISRLGLGRTFQNVRLFKALTVLENVQIGMYSRINEGVIGTLFHTPHFRKMNKQAEEECLDLLRPVGLQDKAYFKASNLSYGQQKVVEIARALAQKPKMLLLDEPAAGLNADRDGRTDQIGARFGRTGHHYPADRAQHAVCDEFIRSDYGFEFWQKSRRRYSC